MAEMNAQEMLEKAEAGVKTLVEKQEQEIKSFGETTEATAKQLKEATQRYDESVGEVKERLDKLEAKSQRDFAGGAHGTAIKATPGMQFVMSEEFKERNGARTDAKEVGNLFGLKTMADLVGDGNDRAPVFAEQVPELFYDPGQRPMRLRDIMNTAPTTSNAVEFFRETLFDPADAASQDGEGGTKAQGQMGFEKITAPVETVANWVAASRQVLDDSPMLQSYIDGRLTYAVEKTLEDQILTGTGADGELTGIMSTTGIGDIGAPASTETILDHIRKAIARVRVSEYEANGIILHPNDWAYIELQKDDDGRYIWVQVPSGGETRLWRVPVIETTAVPEGQFLVGSFGLGAQLWDRMQSTIRISESHESYFIKNMVAILGEMRTALTVYRPQAFCKGLIGNGLSS